MADKRQARRIFIIDDQANDRDLLSGILERNGYTVGTFENGVIHPGYVIGARRVRERKAIGRGQVHFVLLTGWHHHAGESMVHPHEPAARDIRQDTIEDPPVVGIGVKSLVDEIADTASSL